MGLEHYLTVAATLFVIGIFGIFLNRKNVIIILMSIELMLLAVNINLVAFSTLSAATDGAGLHPVRPDGRRGGGRDRAGHPGLLLPQPRHHRRRRRQRDEGLSAMYSRSSSFAAGRRADLRLRLAIIGDRGAMMGLPTGLLFLSCILSWVVFLTFDPEVEQVHDDALDRKRHAFGRLGDPGGPADGDHADRGDHGVGARAPLQLRLHGDDNFRARPRFFAYLSFFTFAMLMLVTADNLVQMFFGWEGVGLASYLLIGFWYRKTAPMRRR
jgi:hypothetical protein